MKVRYGFSLAAVVISAMGLAACEKSIDGKYVAENGLMTLEIKSGKAILGGGNESETADYVREGDKITIKSKKLGGDVVLNVMADGSLQGPLMKFTKTAG